MILNLFIGLQGHCFSLINSDFQGKVNQKVEPTPTSDSTPISPPNCLADRKSESGTFLLLFQLNKAVKYLP